MDLFYNAEDSIVGTRRRRSLERAGGNPRKTLELVRRQTKLAGASEGIPPFRSPLSAEREKQVLPFTALKRTAIPLPPPPRRTVFADTERRIWFTRASRARRALAAREEEEEEEEEEAKVRRRRRNGRAGR